jgi:hypothetical protein
MGIFSVEAPGVLYAAPLGTGDDGTAQTIAMLRNLVDAAWKDPFVNRTAIEIIRNSGAPPFDLWAQLRAIYNYARSFYFVNDPITKEAVRPTRDLLELKAGDCDDINGNVLPALLGTIGFEVRLVTVASDPNAPDVFSHVYCEAFIDGQWYPLDAARPNATIGVAPAFFYRRAWWSLSDDSYGDYSSDAEGGTQNRDVALGGRSRMRGLGSVTSDVAAILTDASGALKSVGGQTVQQVLGPAIGPGGSAQMTPPAAQPFLSSGLGELLLVGAILGGLWLLSKD